MSKEQHTIIVQKYRDEASQPVTSHSYGGLRIYALDGLHEFLGEQCKSQLEPRSAVLDLAAGSGAMSRRLADYGFHVTAADYVSENFQATEIPFVQADLNTNFSEQFGSQSFGGILATEIIEHLENARHFFRQCYALLRPGGKLILSTPNTQNSASIAAFIRSGRFLWFSDNDRSVLGHISPLTQWQIMHALQEVGFKLTWEGSFGEPHSKLSDSLKLRMAARLIDMMSSLPVGLRREIYVCVAVKE